MKIINKVRDLISSETLYEESTDNLNIYNQSALHIYCYKNETQNIKKAILNGVRLDLQDSRGKTALHYSAMNNNHEAVCMLLSKNARTDIADIFGNLALRDAVLSSNGDLRSVEQLLLCASDMHHRNMKNQSTLEMVHRLGDEELMFLFERYNFS